MLIGCILLYSCSMYKYFIKYKIKYKIAEPCINLTNASNSKLLNFSPSSSTCNPSPDPRCTLLGCIYPSPYDRYYELKQGYPTLYSISTCFVQPYVAHSLPIMSKRTSSSRNPKPTPTLTLTASTSTNHDRMKNKETDSKNVAKVRSISFYVSKHTNNICDRPSHLIQAEHPQIQPKSMYRPSLHQNRRHKRAKSFLWLVVLNRHLTLQNHRLVFMSIVLEYRRP